MTPRSLQPGIEAVSEFKALTRRAAELWPDKIGLTFDESGERLTFADIERRSNEVGNALGSLGVGPGDKVAVMLRNRVEFPLVWLGIAKSGAAMVPINVFYKSADAGHLLTHSEAKVMVTSDEFVPLIKSIEGPGLGLETVLSVDGDGGGDGGGEVVDFGALVAGAGGAETPLQVYPEDIANIQYTSGTTGHPKGALISHYFWIFSGGLVARELPGLRPDDVILTAQPYYYADPQWNLVAALLSGAELVVLDRFHPSSFWSKVRQHQVTFFYCLGVMPTLLLKMPAEAADREHRLRLVLCSGIPPASHRLIEERWGVPWYEVYGMTECGLCIFDGPEFHDEIVGQGCVGRPTRYHEVRVVDDRGAALPRGERGEIMVRGPAMMDGYFKNPEATNEVFAGGWLHTGDLARMDEKGLLYFVGRKKDMIRRSGENISAAEVEEVIGLHPMVKIVACTAVPDELRGEEVMAYVVLQEGATAETAPPGHLIAWCEERLAYFKVPRYWTYRDDLPRTPSERVRKELLKGEADDPRLGASDRVDGVWR